MRMKSYQIMAVAADSLFYSIENRRIFIMAFQINEFRKVTNKKSKLIDGFSISPAVITERGRRNAIHDSSKR